MGPLGKLVVVEGKLFSRELTTAIFTFALPLMILYILGGVFGNTPNPEVYEGIGPLDFYVPAYVGLSVAAVGLISLPVHLAEYRERGVLRRFRASTAPIPSVLASQVVVSVVVATVGAALLVSAALLFTDAGLPVDGGRFLAAYLLVALSFAAVGMALGSILPTARSAQAVGLLAWFAQLFLAGAGPPPEVLPDGLLTVAKGLPLTYAVRVLQAPWWGQAWDLFDVAVVSGTLLAGVVVSAIWFRWE